jgi:ABC-type multidrug transport system ATPase subunit
MSHAIELRGVAKLYGRSAALRSLTLHLDWGETLALLGPNGSGKTTLLRILAGAVAPTLGNGTIFGYDLRSERAPLRPQVGYLASESYHYDDLSARENLHFTLTMAGHKPGSEIDRVLAEVGLLASADDRVRTFSSGMRRRLSLARVLLLRPRLLLLDEPYNSLDSDAAALVDEVVRQATAEECVTVVASHDAERVLALAGRVAVLDRGKLVHLGSAASYRGSHVQHVG